MLKKIILIIPAILISFSGITQSSFYKHFEGKVGSSINIVMDIVVSGEKFGGYYYYYFDDHSGDTTWIHYGKSMPVLGTIRSDNSFEFSEFNPDVKGAVFQGRLDKGIIHGTWTSADGIKQLPFEAIENYPIGTMAFNVTYVKEGAPLFEKKKSPAAMIEMSLLLPVGYPVQAVADSVRVYICMDFFNKDSLQEDPATLFNASKEMFINLYRTSNEEIYQEGSESFNWNKIKETRILHNEHDIISLEIYDYGYTGGAHGLSISKYMVIDLKEGKKITLDDIFREDYKNDLRDIINTAARNKYKLERHQSLQDAGFYSEFIDPGDNFYMTKDGIGFYYNQYEVAPFALGPVNIFINYKNLMRILKPDSVVYRLIKKN